MPKRKEPPPYFLVQLGNHNHPVWGIRQGEFGRVIFSSEDRQETERKYDSISVIPRKVLGPGKGRGTAWAKVHGV